MVRSADNSQSTNSGLQQSSGRRQRLSRGGRNSPAVTVPTFKVPRTLADNYLLSTHVGRGIPRPRPGDALRAAVEHRRAARPSRACDLDVRYVGNHGPRQIRGIDYNQVLISQLLPDFLKARNNGLLAQGAEWSFRPAYNAEHRRQPAAALLLALPSGGNLTNGTVRGNIQTGAVGELANYLPDQRLNGPFNFYTNPKVLGANVLTNYSNCYLQRACRWMSSGASPMACSSRRTTCSPECMSDAQGDQQTDFEPFLDINNAKIERSRPCGFDITHVFKANGIVRPAVRPGTQVRPRSNASWARSSKDGTWRVFSPSNPATPFRRLFRPRHVESRGALRQQDGQHVRSTRSSWTGCSRSG